MTELPPASRRLPEADDFPARGRNSLGSIGHRGAARAIDTILVAVPTFVVMLPFLRIEDDEVTLADVPWWVWLVELVLATGYEATALRLAGRTVGKWLIGLRVARYGNGGEPTLAQAVQRVLLPQAAALVPLVAAQAVAVAVYVAAAVFLTAAFDSLRRGFPDKYAGTIVIRTR